MLDDTVSGSSFLAATPSVAQEKMTGATSGPPVHLDRPFQELGTSDSID
ncbi:hypothetical protein [Shinella kummerowiae]|nr:hypothetical protein [Shinella kummerowiae]MCT7668142.1 hypothetical protein [Shinella kummerowiae]